LWRINRLDKNDIYNKDSIYEKLKRKYLPGYEQIFSTDFSDLTFIIPVRIDSDDRKNNFDLVLSFLLKHFNSPIKIIEADKESKVVIKETSSLISLKFVEDNNPVFHKTKYLILMIREVETPYLAVWDTDIIIPPA